MTVKEKETMSSTTLYRLSGIVLLLGAVLSVIAGILTFFVDTSYTASLSTFRSPLWSTYYSLFFVALALILLGLPALYLRQAGRRGGVLGLVGVFLIVLGNFLLMAMIGYFVSILPLLAAKAPQVINAAFESGFGIFPLGGTAFGLIGLILLGIALIRSRVFPPFVGILLIASVVLSLVAFFLQSGDLLAAIIGLLGTTSAAIAYGWVGMVLTTQQNMRGAEVPSSVQTVLR
jgi:hypothetical protein